MTPELHRTVAVERIGPAGVDIQVVATPDECAALAERMQIPAVLSLVCRFRLVYAPDDVLIAHGELVTDVVRTCVISLEDFPMTIRDVFELRCVPMGQEHDDDDPEQPDEITYENGLLDIGEAAAQQLALALEPFPRSPDATLPDYNEEPETTPFAQLFSLKRPN